MLFRSIQSRCAVFKFQPLEESEILKIIELIAEKESLKLDDASKKALYEISNGDCRRAENLLQSAAALATDITGELIFSLASHAKPQDIKKILELAVKNKFIESRELLLKTMLNYGLSGLDIIKQIQKEVWNLSIDDKTKVFLVDKCGEIEFSMVKGSDEFIQLESLLAQFTLAKNK